jgi:hypothetical protein
MTLELVGLLLANGAYLVVGVAALVALRFVTTARETWFRLGVAYLFGVAVLTVPASYFALLRVPVGWTATGVGLIVLALAATRFGQHRNGWRLPSGFRIARPSVETAVGAAIAAVAAVLLLYAARTFAARPLVDWDSWAVWTAKARLLYADPSLAPAALRSGNYGQTPYPLALPTLQSLGFGAMGRYDGTLIGVQFILLACGFPLALWSLLREWARPWTIALAALAVVGAPQVLYQLVTHYADVPLGLFVGLGLAAGAAWLLAPAEDAWLLGCFAVFLGLAGLMKSEGFLFALAGAVALAVATIQRGDRGRLVRAAAGIGALLAIVLPWRVYCAAYGLSTPDYDLGHVTDISYLRAHSDRVRPAATELWRQLTAMNKWGLLVWVILLALAAGALTASWRLLAFTTTWLVLAAGGLLMTYWVSTLPLGSNLTNTSYRTIVSLLIGGAALVPLLVFPRRRREPDRTAA